MEREPRVQGRTGRGHRQGDRGERPPERRQGPQGAGQEVRPRGPGLRRRLQGRDRGGLREGLPRARRGARERRIQHPALPRDADAPGTLAQGGRAGSDARRQVHPPREGRMLHPRRTRLLPQHRPHDNHPRQGRRCGRGHHVHPSPQQPAHPRRRRHRRRGRDLQDRRRPGSRRHGPRNREHRARPEDRRARQRVHPATCSSPAPR